MASKGSSRQWLQRHVADEYVKKAQTMGYRSRAVFKLLELDKKDRLLKPGMRVVDLGAAPGGWSQIAADRVGDNGCVIALDILPMDTIAGVTFIEGDFQEQKVLTQLLDEIGNDGIDLVICDMAPNISGVRAVDQPKAMYLAELALDLALQVLKPGGDFVVKVFQGEGIEDYRRQIQQEFAKLLTRKPESSRSESREVYFVGKSRRKS